MLNDVPHEKRLAYILGPTLDRYQGREKARWAVSLALLGASALVLLVLWQMLTGH